MARTHEGQFGRDERPAQCACGWGAGEQRTVSAVKSHRSHHKTPQCADEFVLIDPSEYTDPAELQGAVPGGDDDEGDELAGDRDDVREQMNDRVRGLGDDGQARVNGNGRAGAQVLGVEQRGRGGRSGTRPGQQHTGYTPIRGAFTFSPILHAFYDWFVSPERGPHAFEGSFEEWLQDGMLDCMSKHWGLEMGVIIRPRPVVTGRNNGHVR